MKKLILMLIPFLLVSCGDTNSSNSPRQDHYIVEKYYDNCDVNFVSEYCYYNVYSNEYDKTWKVDIDDVHIESRIRPDLYNRLYTFKDDRMELVIFKSLIG